ncbi:MAG: transposase [Flavobacteriales bacterium]|nr:transposase [Flavobacteriales bacterium]
MTGQLPCGHRSILPCELIHRWSISCADRKCAESSTPQAKRTLRKEMAQRNRIECNFGQAKNAYGLERIPARLKATSGSWIAAIFLVMNLKVLIDQLPDRINLFIRLFLHLEEPAPRFCTDPLQPVPSSFRSHHTPNIPFNGSVRDYFSRSHSCEMV